MTDAEYEALARTITERVVALRSRYPALQSIQRASFGGTRNNVATLRFEYRTTWVLDDPTRPPSKTNGRRAVCGEGGFWFRLYFYRGRWQGAARFSPIGFGDLKLWFQYGHGGDVSVIVAVTTVLREENEAFCRLHPWQRPNPSLRAGETHCAHLYRMLIRAKKMLASGKRDEGVSLLNEITRLDDPKKGRISPLARYQISLLAWREGRIPEAQRGFRSLADSIYGKNFSFLRDVTMAAKEFDLPRARILLPLIVEEYPSLKSIRLLKTADDEAIRLLDTMLGDAELGVHAAETLFWLGQRSLAVLRTRPDTPERSAIIKQIEEDWRTESAVQELIQQDRRNPHPIGTPRDWAARAADRLNADRNRVSTRIEQLFRTHANGQVRRALSGIAWHLDDQSLIKRLIPIASKDPYDPVRSEAADRIGDLGDRKYVPLLKRMIHDPGRNVAGCSFRSLSRILGDEAIPWFEGLLRSKDRRLRSGAINGLNYHYKGAEYKDKLAKIIDTPDHPARYEAAMRLAWQYKDRRAVPVLLGMVEDQELSDRRRKGAINNLKRHFSIDATVEAEKD